MSLLKMIYLKRLFFKLFRKTPADMEMVKYWRTKEAARAKIMLRDGLATMKIEGEKYAFGGYTRGWLLFGKMSKLKHEIKNQIFNESWALLDKNVSRETINRRIKREVLPRIYALAEESRYDMLPPEAMSVPVREIYRAWTKVSPETSKLRDIMCFILQDDDAYRFRVQWLVQFMPTYLFWIIEPAEIFKKALPWLEHGEVIDDMKERQRLLKRVLECLLNDRAVRERFNRLFREIDWKKVRLTKSDKYFFRAKYFKVDLDKFEY